MKKILATLVAASFLFSALGVSFAAGKDKPVKKADKSAVKVVKHTSKPTAKKVAGKKVVGKKGMGKMDKKGMGKMGMSKKPVTKKTVKGAKAPRK